MASTKAVLFEKKKQKHAEVSQAVVLTEAEKIQVAVGRALRKAKRGRY